MYSELLAAASTDSTRSAQTRSPGQLLDEARRLRARLPGADTVDRRDVPMQLADQLAYDVALVDLCRSAGIATDPAAFHHPLEARRRLEEALARHDLAVEGSDAV
jgi:hypothetical protein